MAKEIEVLVPLKSDFETAKAVLEKFDFKGAKKTIDHYYYDPLRSNLKLNDHQKLMECCRIREKSGQYFVAYKVDQYDGKTWLYSDEYETAFSDLKAMQNVFTHLGLKLLVKVDNTKYTYLTDQYEIVLEDVKCLGTFLEVEVLNAPDDKTVTEIKHDIRRFIETLGLEIGEELNSGKPELMLLK